MYMKCSELDVYEPCCKLTCIVPLCEVAFKQSFEGFA